MSPLFVLKDSANFSTSNNGLTENHFPGFRVVDAKGRIVTAYESGIYTDGTVSANIYVRNYNDDSTTYVAHKTIKMTMDKTGEVEYVISDPAKFRKAINALPLTGGTLSGNITVESTNPMVQARSSVNDQNLVRLTYSEAGNSGIYHYDPDNSSNCKWIIRRDSTGNIYINEDKPIKEWTKCISFTSPTFSLSAGATVWSHSFTLPAHTGYELVGLTSISTNHSQTFMIGGYSFNNTSRVVTVHGKMTDAIPAGSSLLTGNTVTVRALYVAADWNLYS